MDLVMAAQAAATWLSHPRPTKMTRAVIDRLERLRDDTLLVEQPVPVRITVARPPTR